MPRPPVPCARCGNPVHQGRGSLGAGKSICLNCRREARATGAPIKACSASGCGKRVHARGLCGAHYEAQRLASTPLAPIPCLWCAAPHVPRDAKQRYCSRRCAWNHRDANRQRGHTKHRDAIRARDQDTCQLCQAPIDPTLVFPHRWSLTLDHITPRAHGGTDDPDNLRLAHLTCNASRQDKAA